MKRSMLQTGILGICVLQGFLGFTAIGYADQLITVSLDGSAEFDSITEAYNYMVSQTGGTLTENWTIEVLDTSVYEESITISDLVTSRTAQLKICSRDPTGDKPTIHTPLATADYPRARPMAIHGTDFVTIRGFIFMKDVPNVVTDIMTSVNFKDHTPVPLDSQITFDNCVWEGRGQTYDLGAVLFCLEPHCNITVQNSTFQNIVVGPINASLVYLGPRTHPMANTPTFKFIGNQVINNAYAMVQLEGDSVNGYYHNIVVQDNDFIGNEGDPDLLFIRSQRAAKDISSNRFFGNWLSGIPADVFSGMTLALINSGSATVAGNTFLQNGAMAEVFVQDSSTATTKLTGNLIAASPGLHFGVWADLGSKTVLQSSSNTFYSNYSTKDPWNTARTDCVAAWGTGKVALTLDKWNAKTPKDGSDSLAAPGKLPPTP
jgi:hypothetical protein